MIFESSFMVDASAQEVWDYLIDIPRMSVCFPGMQKVEQTDANTYTGVVTAKVGSITTSFQGSVVKILVEPPHRLVSKVHLWDATTASAITGEFASDLLALAPARTQVNVHFDLVIRGRLNQVEQSEFDEIFQRLLAEFSACVRRRIERPANPTQWSTAKPNRLQAWLQALFSYLRARTKAK